ncbi:MAG: hypothetical protein KC800_11865 [Candidatus Eremiobacteraeota bacterium]|nr:hypothetical protein [Candidatus Eremiobacteraeota bacterium]
MNTTVTSPKRPGRKNSKRTQAPEPAKLSDFPGLEDQFLKQNQTQDRLHLMEEQIEKMSALRQVHLAKLQAIRDQVQLELFKIWNEMWLQKKAAYSKAHKEFLKVLAA